MNIHKSRLPDCYEIRPKVFTDIRGSFVKTFHKDIFEQNALAVEFVEQYYSRSQRNVLRGLHFQLPPHDHAKLVYCIYGEVVDVVVDLRSNSSSYGQFEMLELSAEKANMVYIPSGIAHGFLVVSESATLVYNVTTVHSPEHDSGIRWDSLDIPWPCSSPIVSEKDQNLPSFEQFITPF